MKVLTVGGGGREHAIVEAFHRAGSEIFAVMKNANPGILDRASKYKLVDETKVDEVCAFAKECGVELAFVGPEAPLAAGLVDALEKIGIKCASPTQAAARIEDVPNPDPFGTPVTSECMMKPPPRRFRMDGRSPPFFGMTPQASSAAFWRANGS